MTTGKSVTLYGRTLLQLIATAYRMRVTEVVGPGWSSELRFDIDARLPSESARRTANEMLQVLLEDRFALHMHRELRSVSGFALRVSKEGHHLSPAEKGVIATDGLPDPTQLRGAIEKLASRQHKSPVGMWQSNSATLAEVALAVSHMLHVPVVDETALIGTYSVALEVSAEDSPDDTWDYRVKQAVEKLGLKLDTFKVSTSILVVDSAMKVPLAN